MQNGNINFAINAKFDKEKLVNNSVNYHHSSMRFYEAFNPKIKLRFTPCTALFEN